jgi:uncharacterized protein Usg
MTAKLNSAFGAQICSVRVAHDRIVRPRELRYIGSEWKLH